MCVCVCVCVCVSFSFDYWGQLRHTTNTLHLQLSHPDTMFKRQTPYQNPLRALTRKQFSRFASWKLILNRKITTWLIKRFLVSKGQTHRQTSTKPSTNIKRVSSAVGASSLLWHQRRGLAPERPRNSGNRGS